MDCRTAETRINAYINKTMSMEEMKGFIEHIRSCPSCYDELETYYTVYFAVRHLDEDEGNESYDMAKMLNQDLERQMKNIRRKKRKKILLTVMLLIMILIIAALIYFLIARGDL